jgi:polysaccharide export outer membrane protein
MTMTRGFTISIALATLCVAPAYAQRPASGTAPNTATSPKPAPTATAPAPSPAPSAPQKAAPTPKVTTAVGIEPAGIVPPPDYVIGPDDQLSIVFFREKDLTTDVTVRPDGKISLPLMNDIEATGLKPEQLRAKIAEAAGKFIEDTTVTVVVKQINSRRVFITGQVPKPGPYSLTGPMTVLQLIAVAGGVNEYADSEHIVILRTEKGRQTSLEFNYKDVAKRRNLQQNIDLKPDDTVVVP